jgi:hypothetical protein
MPKSIRLIAFAVAVVAGALLLTSGIRGPIGTYQTIIDLLPHFIQDQQILQIANTVAAILITISLAGGLAVIAGGVLILMNRVGTGKFVIGLGTGVGVPWLIMLVITLITAQQVASAVAEYSAIGFAGLILAVAARTIAR